MKVSWDDDIPNNKSHVPNHQPGIESKFHSFCWTIQVLGYPHGYMETFGKLETGKLQMLDADQWSGVP